MGEIHVVHWLEFSTFSAVAQVQSLVRELRSHKLCGTAKKKRKTGMKEFIPIGLCVKDPYKLRFPYHFM